MVDASGQRRTDEVSYAAARATPDIVTRDDAARDDAARDNVREGPRLVTSQDGAPPAARRDASPASEPQAPAARETTAPTRPASGAQATKVQASGGRRRTIRYVLYGLVPIALIVGAYFYVTGGQVMSTDNAYVQADMVGVTTDVSGMVSEVDVTENQRVKKGDVLFKLDDRQYRYALERAKALVGTTRDQLEAVVASYKDMQAQIVQAQNDIDFYTREFKRQQDLMSRQVASQATLDQARHNLETAQQKLASLKAQLAGIVANLDGNPDIRIEDHPRYKDAVAQRDEAARELADTVVRAPMDGIATNVSTVQPGQYMEAANAALTATTSLNVISTDHVWVQANPKETELTYVRPGQHLTVTVDTYPGVTWDGEVASINPASAASFSLLPAQNTSGNWVKVVQRIPMRVRIETPAGKPPLRVGMSVVVNVDTGHARGLPEFLQPLVSWWTGRHG